MADLTDSSRTNSFPGEVIDLTLSDVEDPLPQHRVLQFRQPSETSSSERSDTTLPEHGLPLERNFGSSNRWESNHSNRLKFGLRRRVPSQLRHCFVSNPSNIDRDASGPPQTQQIPAYHINSAKRRHIELDNSNPQHGKKSSNKVEEAPRNPQIDLPKRTLIRSSLLPSPRSDTAPAPQVLQHIRGGDGKHKDIIHESLKVALRQQVFPHINQYLSHYRLSIDNAMRRQLGKQAAWEICDEDFMDDLMRNGGRLSATFETKIAAMARSLIDQYAVSFTNDSIKGQGCNKYTPLHNGQHKTNSQKRDECSAEVLADSTEAAIARKKAKLSIAMKGRWDRGEMDSVVFRRRAKNHQKRAGKNRISTSQYRKGLSLQPPATPSGTLSPQISSDDDIKLPVRRHVSKHQRKKTFQHFASNMLSSGHALNQGQSILELGKSIHSVQRPTRHSTAKGASATVVDVRTLPNARETNGKQFNRSSEARNLKELVAVARSHEAHHQIENLRLAGLDGQVSRPYLSWEFRKDLERGLALIQSKQKPCVKVSRAELTALHGSTLHVDFCQEEIEHLIPVIELAVGSVPLLDPRDPKAHVEVLMRGQEKTIPQVVAALNAAGQAPGSRLLQYRTNTAIEAFLQDAAARRVSTRSEVKRVKLRTMSPLVPAITLDSVKSILQQRETWGMRRNPGACRSFKAQLVNLIEDDLIRQAEWTDCAGDIATISWIDGDRFLCGATAHSDEHNMQYNKPGNFLVGSVVEKTLKSVPGHQIVRPIVTAGENSLASMRSTQDPWMYCSVTSTAYSHDNKKCFTGSYDQTVKVWDIAHDGSSMSLCGTWKHSGNVNFVVASPSHNLVATAADVREDAVRVYHVNHSDISKSAFSIYEASVQRRNSNDTWAYFPATVQWGISPSVSHLLLVGYSPRSFNCLDTEIPDDRVNTGELCLWDSRDGSRVPITSARTQNVFEVAWHPSQPIFVAATSPAGTFEDWVKTQLRIFEQNACGSFSHMKTLDCSALDINEITIMPNSVVDCYVTASCTDGNTYVWDSALSDRPIHILSHGESIDEQTHGATREEADSGVKFAAWGKNSDRFYTGSSDGIVKAWNIRAPPGLEFVRNVIKLSGGVSAGKFSPDFGKLVIGDSTGKVHYLAIGDKPCEERLLTIRRPITPHPPLPVPLIDDDDLEIPPEPTAQERAQQYLDREQITIHKDKYIGAIQGPNYASTGLFYDVEKYKDMNGEDSAGWSAKELWEKQQQRYRISGIQLSRLPSIQSSSRFLHQKNVALDLDVAILPLKTLAELREEQVDFCFQDENYFLFEPGPRLGVKEVGGSLSEEEELLDDAEIQQLQALKERICQELRIQKCFKGLF